MSQKLNKINLFKNKALRLLFKTSLSINIFVITFGTTFGAFVTLFDGSLSVQAAATPVITLTYPSQVMIGEDFNISADFNNTGMDAGYGPFIDLIVPFNGVDGVFPYNPTFEADGIDYLTATFLSTNLTTTVQQFTTANGGCVLHPYAVDNTGAEIQVCGIIGEKLITIQLPFGSFIPGQPNIAAAIGLNLSSFADAGVPLDLQIRGGFQFGITALNDFNTDPSVVEPFVNYSVTPIVFELSKTNNAPENETATGPSYPRDYNVSVNLANNQVLTNLQLTDELSNRVAYLQLNSVTPAGFTVVTEPPVGTPQNLPAAELLVSWPTITGSNSTSDASYDFRFFVPDFDANGDPVIGNNGGCTTINNNALATATWTPLDPRDPLTPVNSDITPIDDVLNACSHVARKSVSNVIDSTPAGNTPGDVMEYQIIVELSDYFAVDNMVINDVMSDGQRFDTSFTPQISFNSKQGSLPVTSFSPANFTVIDHFTGAPLPVAPIDGTQEVNFALSNQINDSGVLAGNPLIGGCIPDCTGNVGTTAVVTFRSIIQQEFTDDFAPQNQNVDQGDILTNSLAVTADTLDDVSLVPNGGSYTNPSGTTFSIVTGILATKDVYAINGVIGTYNTPRISPGDTVTYRIAFNLPLSDVEDLIITDFLPLPVFDAATVTTFDSSPANSLVPPAGTAKFGANDTFNALYGIVPIQTVDVPGNSVAWNFGSNQTLVEQASVIEIYLSVQASAIPFADGLFLTNQAQSNQATTNASSTTATQITQIELALPNVSITKGVIATDAPSPTFVPAIVGPQAFSAPGSTCSRFVGTINSTNLSLQPINSNIENVDAGDLVSFALVLENTGDAPNGAFDIQLRDLIPAGYQVPGGGINLCVTDGNGVSLPFTAVNGGDTEPLLQSGIELTDPTPISGALTAFDATNGTNIAIITYDLELASNVLADSQLINTGYLTNYASSTGGIDFTTSDQTDESTTQIQTLQLAKSIVSTNQAHTLGNNVSVGEIVDFQLDITVPEGISNNLMVMDNFPEGLSLVNVVSINAPVGVTTDVVGGFSTVALTPVVTSSGRNVNFNFGNVTNTNSSNSTPEIIEITLQGVVTNNATNNAGFNLSNSAQVFVDSNLQSTASTPNLTVVEPVITLNKASSLASWDQNDVTTFTITVNSPALANTADAFEVSVQDVLPANVTFDGGLAYVSGNVPTSLTESLGTITAEYDSFPAGTSSVYSFNGRYNLATLGQSTTNIANATWTSLPTDVTTSQSTYTPLGVERTGNTTNPGGSVNDHVTSAQVVINQISTSPVKTITSSSENDSGIVSGTLRGLIGEVIRYRLTAVLPEAAGTNVQFRDNLPTGLQFINDNTATVAFVSNDLGISSTTLDPVVIGCDGGGNPDLYITGNQLSSAAAVTPLCVLPGAAVSSSTTTDVDTYSSGTDVFFKLGDLTNSDNDADSELVVIEFNALIINIAANQAGTQLNNNFSVLNNGNVLQTSSNNAGSRVFVAEPVIGLAKSVIVTPLDAGDAIEYRLTVTNTSAGVNAAPAYNINVLDAVDAQIIVSGTSFTGTAINTNNSVGNNVDYTIQQLNPGESAYISIFGTLILSVSPGQDIVNNSSLTYTSLPGPSGTVVNPTGTSTPGAAGSATGERDGSNGAVGLNDYFASSSTTTTVGNNVALDKTYSGAANLTLGDTATFDLVVTLAEGITNLLTVTDVLPSGLEYESHTLITSDPSLAADYNGAISPITVNGGAASGDDVSFEINSVDTFGDNIVNNNTFIIRVTTRVANVIGNQNNAVLNNTANLTYQDPNNVAATLLVQDLVPVQITVVEPILDVSKTILNLPPSVQAGQNIQYQVLIQHDAASLADAHQVIITDTLPVEFDLISNVQILDQLNNPLAIPFLISGNTLTVGGASGVSLANNGSQIRVIFDARVNTGASVTLNNSASAVWSSTVTDVTGTRESGTGSYDSTETGINGINDYSLTAISATASTDGPLISKSIVSSSLNSTLDTPLSNQLAVGEEFSYFLLVTLPEGNTALTEIVDDLPDNVAFVGYQVITLGAGSFGTFTNDFNGSLPSVSCAGCSSGSISADLTFTLTNADVTIDGNLANNQFGIRIDVQAVNIPLNTAPASFINEATVQANAGPVVNSNTVLSEIVEPNLVVSAEFSPVVDIDFGHAGEVMGFNYQITNTGNAIAYDNIWSLNLDAFAVNNFSYQSGSLSVTCTNGLDVATVLPIVLPNIQININQISVGATCNISFNAQIDQNLNVNTTPFVQLTGVVSNVSSLPGANAAERTYSNLSATDTVNLTAPDLTIVIDDGRTVVGPNDTLIYNMNISNIGNTNASGVVINVVIPTGTTFDDANSSVGWICSPDANPGSTCTFEYFRLVSGTLAPSAADNVLFALTVDTNILANTIVVAADINDDGTHGQEVNLLNNTSSDTDTVGSYVDLAVNVTDNRPSVTYNESIIYAIDYNNLGNTNANNVVITAIVPNDTVFDALTSAIGWTCLPSAAAGSVCTLNVGTVNLNSTLASINFGVITNNYVPLVPDYILDVSIDYDGAVGPDVYLLNNNDNETTPYLYANVFDPPSGFKTVDGAGNPILVWRMVWINNGNTTALMTRITDLIPANTTYVAGSFICEALGLSVTTSCSFDSINNMVVWEGDIAPDFGALNENDSQNEVILTFSVRLQGNPAQVNNQARANWDDNLDGSIADDISNGQIASLSDDPRTSPNGDPTVWVRPTLANTGSPLAMSLIMGLVTLIATWYLHKQSRSKFFE